jgi:alanyl-tRNA synthetase
MTERLYYTDSYLTRFEAAVVDRADGGRRIYLDRTAFYPTSGGQPFDLGSLGGVAVTDVVDEGERIAHLLAAPLEASQATGTVDWTRRLDHMQQHTGQHVLSAVLAELFGWPTVSVHFGGELSTLDLDSGAITPEQVVAAEARANAVVWEDRPVAVSFEDAASAEGLRKATERSGTIRVVSIRDLDRSACGGTHLRATGEIGAILIRKTERVRKQVRLEFVCGARAMRRARADHELLQRLAASASAAPDELPALLDAQRAELKALQAARRDAEARVQEYRARELYTGAAPGPDGNRRAVVTDAASLEQLRGLAQAYTALPRTLLRGARAAPPTVLYAASADAGIDAGARMKDVLGQAGGRGGGNARLAQGTVPNAEALARTVELLSASG